MAHVMVYSIFSLGALVFSSHLSAVVETILKHLTQVEVLLLCLYFIQVEVKQVMLKLKKKKFYLCLNHFLGKK